MSEPGYYIRERNRVAGPYDLDQLREMRRRNRLARFHMVSTDGKTWVEADTLEELFAPEHGPVADPPPRVQDPAPRPSPPHSPGSLWYYALGSTVHGPVTTRFLQNLIDQGSAAPDLPVRTQRGVHWSRCDEVGIFRFPAHSSAHAKVVSFEKGRRLRLLTAHPWVVGSIVAVPVAAVAVTSLIMLLVPAHRSANDRGRDLRGGTAAGAEPASVAIKRPDPAAGAPTPTEKKPLAAKPPATLPTPPPQRPPARPPAAEVRSANVELPSASVNLSQHDSAIRALKVALPRGSGYRLRLHGLDDPEIQKYRLSTRQPLPARTDSLAVIHPPLDEAGRRAKTADSTELARFWIEDGRLLFRWATKVTRDMIEPVRALRDCVLEVETDASRLKLTLREPIKDLEFMSVSRSRGGRTVEWKNDSPTRKLRFISCKVKIDGKWTEAKPNADRDECHLTIDSQATASKAGPSSESPFELTVTCDSAKSALLAGFNSTPIKLNQELKRRINARRRISERIGNLRQQLAATEQTIREYIAGVNVELGRQGQGNVTLSDFAERLLAQIHDLDHPPTQLRFNRSGNQYLDGLFDQVINLLKEHTSLQEQYKHDDGHVPELSKALDRLTRLGSAPIQVHLGMFVEGELVEIAAIGRE
jgi:hypothetical protein